MVSIYAAGNTIDAQCTRCRADRQHTIVAMIGENVVRVRCDSCQSEHRFHPPASGAQSSNRKTAKSKKNSSAAPVSDRRLKTAIARNNLEWLEAVQERSSQTAIPYSMDELFHANDLIEHPLFGLGIVQKISQSRKMEILFKEGRKILRCRSHTEVQQ